MQNVLFWTASQKNKTVHLEEKCKTRYKFARLMSNIFWKYKCTLV